MPRRKCPHGRPRMRDCKACVSDRNRANWSKTGRARAFRSRYGIEIPDYESLVLLHENRCAICDRTPSGAPGAKGQLCLDHNHRTGQVRGLLCDNCNKGLGLLQDDPALLEKAAGYLRSRGH